MRATFYAACFAAAIAFGAPTAAMAAQTLTFNGSLTSGNENAGGPFGPANGSLAGAAYSVTLAYDPSQFLTSNTSINSCGLNAGTSCTFAFAPGRTVTETISVTNNNLVYTTTYTISTGTLTLSSNGNGADQFNVSFQAPLQGLNSLSAGFTAPGGQPNAFFPSSNVNNPTFSNITNLALTNANFNQSGTNYNLGANGNAATLNASTTGAVPELAPWTLMILGFGLVGATMRRRTVRYAFA